MGARGSADGRGGWDRQPSWPSERRGFQQGGVGRLGGVQELARAVRDLVFEVLPQTVEVVWPKQGSVGWGTGPKKFSEQFAYLMPFKRHVTLGFYYGGELPDPGGLLPESGGRQVAGKLAMRSLKIASIGDVSRPELRSLMEAAVRHRVPPPSG